MTESNEARALDFARVIRLKATLESIREELRSLAPDMAARQRLAQVHNAIEGELAEALPSELRAELTEFSSCCHDNPHPTRDEVRVAQAQVIGWIEGLLQGVRLSLATAPPDIEAPVAQDAAATGPAPDDAAYV